MTKKKKWIILAGVILLCLTVVYLCLYFCQTPIVWELFEHKHTDPFKTYYIFYKGKIGKISADRFTLMDRRHRLMEKISEDEYNALIYPNGDGVLTLKNDNHVSAKTKTKRLIYSHRFFKNHDLYLFYASSDDYNCSFRKLEIQQSHLRFYFDSSYKIGLTNWALSGVMIRFEIPKSWAKLFDKIDVEITDYWAEQNRYGEIVYEQGETRVYGG